MECSSRRQALRAAFQLGWIGDEPLWLDRIDDRNRSSHTDNERIAEETFARLPQYRSLFAALLGRLNSVTAGAGG